MFEEDQFNEIEADVLLEALEDGTIGLDGYVDEMKHLGFTKSSIRKRLKSAGLFDEEEWILLVN